MAVTYIKTWIVTDHPINTREGWREFRREQFDRISKAHKYTFGMVSEPNGREFLASNGRYQREQYVNSRSYFFGDLNGPLSERLRLFKSRGWIIGSGKYRYRSTPPCTPAIAAE